MSNPSKSVVTKKTAEKSNRWSWMTRDQWEWLINKLPAYQESRSTNDKSDFWPPIYKEWFEKWLIISEDPNQETAELMDKKKAVSKKVVIRTVLLLTVPQQIRNWFKSNKKKEQRQCPLRKEIVC